MNTNTKTEGHKLLDRLLVVSLAKNHEAGRIIADRLEVLERENAALREAIAPFASVADEYDKNCLDECRPEWGGANDEATEILTGRGGKPLLSLRHFIQARSALKRA